MEDIQCVVCGVKFPFYRNKGRNVPRFCSHKCRLTIGTGFRPGGQIRINELTADEKLERLKKSFEKNVIRQEGCWSWKGSIAKGGYPVMSCRPTVGPDRGHRASYVIHKGEIPKGYFVCHACDNPICTNPEHLWLGTHKQNNDDKIAKGRGRYAKPPHKVGSQNGSAKLSEEDVIKIKELINEGHSCYSIGKEFGVTGTTIKRIKNGDSWKHVTVDNVQAL